MPHTRHDSAPRARAPRRLEPRAVLDPDPWSRPREPAPRPEPARPPDEPPTKDHRSGRARILPITAAAAALVLAGGTAAFAHAQKTVTLDVDGEVDAAEHVRRLGRRPPRRPGRRRRRARRREPERRRCARAPRSSCGTRTRSSVNVDGAGDVRLDDRAVRRRGARLARRPRPVRRARRVPVRRRWPPGARARPHAARSGRRRSWTAPRSRSPTPTPPSRRSSASSASR